MIELRVFNTITSKKKLSVKESTNSFIRIHRENTAIRMCEEAQKWGNWEFLGPWKAGAVTHSVLHGMT